MKHPKRILSVLKQILLLLNLLSFTAADYGDLSDSGLSMILKHGHFHEIFQSWAKKFKKEYIDTTEELRRYEIWLKNNEFIEMHNNQVPSPSFKLGHNQFSDMTNKEYQQLYALGNHNKEARLIYPRKNDNNIVDFDDSPEVEVERQLLADLPDEVDWVKEGAVTRVSSQGSCGSCWAFSVFGGLEGAKFLRDGELVELSVQMLLDCDTTNKGCNGGTQKKGYNYTRTFGGVCTEQAYPFEGRTEGNCRARECGIVTDTMLTRSVRVKPNENSLLEAIAKQPVSVSVEAYLPYFQLYASGVFDYSGCGADIDHAALATGYGYDNDLNATYWTIKNSWGVTWGEDGYMRLARDSDLPMGTCGIYRQNDYPIL